MISPAINKINYLIKNKDDYIQRLLIDGHQWNNDIFCLVQKYINERKVTHFLNVGCHIGTVCLPISCLVEKATAIEAYPPTYKHLCENIQLNNITNITALNFAIGNNDEPVYFMSEDKVCPRENKNRFADNSGGMHVFTELDIQENRRSSVLTDKKVSVQMKKIDDLDVDNFDIMLVDIEGCEYELLLGAREKIMKNKPILIVEIWGDYKRQVENMATRQQEVIQYILSMNYKLVGQIEDDFIFEPV